MTHSTNLVEDSEKIGRFIFSQDHFSSVTKQVKYAAFLPASDKKASVYRIDGYTEEQIRDIDQEFVSGKRTDGKVSKARADLLAAQIRQSQLDVVPDPFPHIHHANIEGYSSEKSENKLKAIELAKKAILVQKQESNTASSLEWQT
ncbi:MAG: hypothetical protein WA347_05400 [Rhabdochlamydiaceae bacterium]|jgi:hypothetical protein